MASALFRFSLEDRIGTFAFSVPTFGDIESARHAFKSALRYRRTLLKLNLGQTIPLIIRSYQRYSAEIIQIEVLDNLRLRRYDFDYEISIRARSPWLHVTAAPEGHTILTMPVYAWLGREYASKRFGYTLAEKADRFRAKRSKEFRTKTADELIEQIGNPVYPGEPERFDGATGYRSRAQMQELHKKLNYQPPKIPRRIRVDFSKMLTPNDE